jgi:hypothetical protein
MRATWREQGLTKSNRYSLDWARVFQRFSAAFLGEPRHPFSGVRSGEPRHPFSGVRSRGKPGEPRHPYSGVRSGGSQRGSQAHQTCTGLHPAFAGCLAADAVHSRHCATHGQQSFALAYVAGDARVGCCGPLDMDGRASSLGTQTPILWRGRKPGRD